MGKQETKRSDKMLYIYTATQVNPFFLLIKIRFSTQNVLYKTVNVNVRMDSLEQPLVPALDHLASAEGELERLVPGVAAVKFCTIFKFSLEKLNVKMRIMK